VICPHCKNIYAPKKVLNTWALKNGMTRRKRFCGKCKKVFYTSEMVSVVGKTAIIDKIHG